VAILQAVVMAEVDPRRGPGEDPGPGVVVIGVEGELQSVVPAFPEVDDELFVPGERLAPLGNHHQPTGKA